MSIINTVFRTPMQVGYMPSQGGVNLVNANNTRKQPVFNTPLASAVQWLYYAYSSDLITDENFVLQEVSDEGYKIFDRMLDRDAHLFSNFDKLKSNAANLPFHIMPASDDPRDQEIAAFTEEALAQADLEEIMKEVYRSVGIGFGVYEAIYEPFNFNGKAKQTIKEVIHVEEDYIRANTSREFLFCPPGASIDKGVPFQPRQKYISLRYGSGVYGDGLLKHAYPAYWFKRNSQIFCMQYYERFGNPPVIGRHRNDTERDSVVSMLLELRSGTVASIPDTQLPPTVLEPTKDANFLGWLNFLNDEMSKIFMFGTRTFSASNASGAKSSTETHAEEADDRAFGVHKRGIKILNKQIIPHIVRLNYGIQKAYPYAVPGSKDIDDSNDYLDKIKKTSEAKIKVTVSKTEFYEKSGLSKPNPQIDDDELIIGEVPTAFGGPTANFTEGEPSKSSVSFPQISSIDSSKPTTRSREQRRRQLTNWQKRMGWM